MQIIDYEDVVGKCTNLSGIATTVAEILIGLNSDNLINQNQGYYSEAFKEIVNNFNNIVTEMHSFMEGYAKLVSIVAKDYEKVEQNMKNMIKIEQDRENDVVIS